MACFFSFVSANFESSVLCDSFGISIDVRKLVRGHGERLSRKKRQNAVV